MNHHDSRTGTYFLSLRWKALLGISLVLILINTALGFYAYHHLVTQFEQHQTSIREQQSNQLRTLLTDRYQQMSQLANLLPLFASHNTMPDMRLQLQQIFNENGSLLDLEWDIRSVHLIDLQQKVTLLWPLESADIPPPLFAILQHAPEKTATWLACQQDCRQYLAVPQLWHGQHQGTLVLGRLVADVLLAFWALTNADIALAIEQPNGGWQFPAATHPATVVPLLMTLPSAQLRYTNTAHAYTWWQQGDWFELFRLELTPALTAFVINRITSQRYGIARITRNSVIIGLVGLVIAELLLLLVMQQPMRRLRQLAQLLPLLAEERFTTFAQQLPRIHHRYLLRDEMDLTLETVGHLNQQMAALHQERATAQQELIWLADHDPLTRLPNRRLFYRTFAAQLERTRRGELGGTLLFFDLDRFKDVNDIDGHLVGDQLLEQVASAIQAFIGNNGFVSRFGGDEFALLLPQHDVTAVCALATALQQQLAHLVFNADHQRHQLSASIGIVLFPEHGDDVHILMANADLAMYQAKRLGRGRWHLYSEQDEGRNAARIRLLWTDRIVEALQEERFEVHYQPLLEVATGRIWRAEALVRMRDTQGSLLSPGLFIPVAEETNLINTLDRWVLTQALICLQQHPQLSLSVNLSGNALIDRHLSADIRQLITDAGVAAARLTFEITETVAISSMSDAIQLIETLQAFGCHFALDDFGSGFASYAYLKQLPVNDVKIDGAFIRDLHCNPEDRIFVRAVIEMAHAMNKRVVAEFVESAEILAILRELNVDFAQGYYIGKPSPQPPV